MYFWFKMYIKKMLLYYIMNNIEFDLNKMSERLLKLEDENENLKVQVKQLKKFGEIQVGLNSKQSRQIRQLVNENEKLNDYVKILSS
jgi:DNA-dependent RNA polymerase auxiliary subunit epsilon